LAKRGIVLLTLGNCRMLLGGFIRWDNESQNMPVFCFTGVFLISKIRQYLLFLANNEVAF